MPRSYGSNRGFTLIEVAVALAIVALAVGAVAGVLSSGLLGTRVAGDVDAALAVAQEKLAEPEAAAAMRPGHAEGVFAERFEWRRTVSPYDDEAAPSPDPLATVLRLYRIEVAVAWRDGHRRRQVALSTLRLAPVPP